MLQTIKEEFLNELNNPSPLCGSLYTAQDVARIITAFGDRVDAIEQPARPAQIDADTIKAIAQIAERHALLHAQNCADNYEFDDIDFNTDEYRGQLTVNADVNVDSHSLARSATFHTSLVEADLRELLTPNVTPPNTETNA